MKTAQFKIGQLINVCSLQGARVLAKCAYPAGHAPAWIVECDGILYEATDCRVMKISSKEAIELSNPALAIQHRSESMKAFTSVFGAHFDNMFA